MAASADSAARRLKNSCSPREPVLQGYHLLPSVRGDLLHKLGRYEEAHAEFEAAARLAGNHAEGSAAALAIVDRLAVSPAALAWAWQCQLRPRAIGRAYQNSMRNWWR
jgi:hypothetical protein